MLFDPPRSEAAPVPGNSGIWWLETKSVRLVPQDILRAVAVVNVEIDHGDARQAPPFQRMQRADGDVPKKQKPMARVFSAWWPGGRVATKALVARPSSTASMAAIMPPTPGARRPMTRAGVGVGVERDQSRFGIASPWTASR
jgi:hypothetical protein